MKELIIIIGIMWMVILGTALGSAYNYQDTATSTVDFIVEVVILNMT